MILDNLDYKDDKNLNESIKNSKDYEIKVNNCLGTRYIACGLGDKRIIINGTAGNALGAYMNGAEVIVNGNAQDAVGDTMNEGTITIHGSSGDATGYGMRGGQIYVRDDVGYRAGIHMKAYESKLPILVVGGAAGSFLGEYQAGGLIVILNRYNFNNSPVGYFCGTGMHGGKIYIRSDRLPSNLPPQVMANEANKKDIDLIAPYVKKYADNFSCDYEELINTKFYVLTANTKNPYKQLYTHN